jgi:hypothetical protein
MRTCRNGIIHYHYRTPFYSPAKATMIQEDYSASQKITLHSKYHENLRSQADEERL